MMIPRATSTKRYVIVEMMPPNQEILPPAIKDRAEADQLIKSALGHFREARKTTIQTMVDLRRLQDGDVHVLYGYRNFAKWCEDTFEGLAAGSVRQLTRAGGVVIELNRRKLIDIQNPKGVGTTALRDLATISGTYGNDKMAEVFITARQLLEGGGEGRKTEISNVTVDAAMRLLMPPTQPSQTLIDERGANGNEPDDDDDGTEYSDKVQELMERIQDLSWDLPESAEELEETARQLRRQVDSEKNSEDQTWLEGTR